MYLLTTFKQKVNKKDLTPEEKKTNKLRNRALIGGALTLPGLVTAGMDVKNASNMEEHLDNLIKRNKAVLTALHPDKYEGTNAKELSEVYKAASVERNNLRSLRDEVRTRLQGKKGLQKLKAAIRIGYEHQTKRLLEDVAEKQSQKLGQEVVFTPEQVEKITKAAKLGKKVDYALTGLGALTTGIAAARYLNRKRKERADKGKIRGKYNT